MPLEAYRRARRAAAENGTPPPKRPYVHHATVLNTALPRFGRNLTLTAGAVAMTIFTPSAVTGSAVGKELGSTAALIYWFAVAAACLVRALFLIRPRRYSAPVDAAAAFTMAIVWGLALYASNRVHNQPAAVFYAALTVEEAITYLIARRTIRWW